MSRSTHLFLAALTALAVGAGIPVAASASAAPNAAAPDGSIVFERDGDIWVLPADGSPEVNLTNTEALEADPAWSADGSQIVFVSNRTDAGSNDDANLEVFTMASDGSAVTQVTDTVYPFPGQSGYDHYEPAISPDGSRIAYVWNGPTGGMEIYTIAADGSDEQLLSDPGDFASKGQPAWSPDGSRITFTWGFGYLSGQDIHVIDAAGSLETNLTPDTPNSDELLGVWSPDGSMIAFVSTRDPSGIGLPNEEIYVMLADGTAQTRLTEDDAFDTEPSWSLDGTQIVFSSSRSGAYDLYTIDVPPLGGGLARTAAAAPDADGARQLTHTAASERDPSSATPVAAAPNHLLRATTAGTGKGRILSKPAGILCGRDCAQSFADGTRVSLRAQARPGSVFAGWSGACTGTGSCRIGMRDGRDVIATFNRA